MSDQSRVESDPGEDESEALGESSPWREGEAVVMPDWVCSVVWLLLDLDLPCLDRMCTPIGKGSCVFPQYRAGQEEECC